MELIVIAMWVIIFPGVYFILTYIDNRRSRKEAEREAAEREYLIKEFMDIFGKI